MVARPHYLKAFLTGLNEQQVYAIEEKEQLSLLLTLPKEPQQAYDGTTKSSD
jgi:hypothetical protein